MVRGVVCGWKENDRTDLNQISVRAAVSRLPNEDDGGWKRIAALILQAAVFIVNFANYAALQSQNKIQDGVDSVQQSHKCGRPATRAIMC